MLQNLSNAYSNISKRHLRSCPKEGFAGTEIEWIEIVNSGGLNGNTNLLIKEVWWENMLGDKISPHFMEWLANLSFHPGHQ